MITLKKQLKTELRILLFIVACLIAIGFIFIYSSSSVFASQKFGSASYFVKKHIVGLFLGIIALIIARMTPLWFIKKYSPLFFFSSLTLTSLTLIPALSHRIHGSNRWLNLAGFSFQPSELLKISLIMYIAYFLTKKEREPLSFIHGYLPLLIILGSTSLVLLAQPDFGLVVTLTVTACIMLYIAHFYIRYLWYTVLSLVPIGIILIAIKPYRIKRILTFLNPWADPQGSGFQIIQSLIAIGSGGISGVGIGQSKQKFFYLPMQHTDFIFSIIAEETGFIGSLILVALFMAFLFVGLRIAHKLNDSFSRLCVSGFCFVISFQAIINIAVATGLAPTKGIGLPFVSYGNSALMCQLMTIGLIINMVCED